MVAPVTGPFSKVTIQNRDDGFGPYAVFDHRRTWSRQKKPYNLHLGFSLELQRCLKQDSVGRYNLGNSAFFLSNYDTFAYNKAYGKFVDAARDSASWAVNLAEYHQTLDSLVARTTQLTRFARKLHHFDFIGAAKELKLSAVPKGVKPRKAFANNFLEYHFGWEPLVKDIGATIDIFQKPYPQNMRVSGKGHEKYRSQFDINRGNGYHEFGLTVGEVYARIDATVSVSNPNLLLANQMGFVNPLVVAWELVPFSFVVDWFTNVGQVIGSMSDLWGLNIVSSSHTSYQRFQKQLRYISFANGSLYGSADFENAYCYRNPGIGPGPSLTLRPLKPISFTRAATAISLLLQQLRH